MRRADHSYREFQSSVVCECGRGTSAMRRLWPTEAVYIKRKEIEATLY